ncbi:MAG: TetR/AcrR family transcriptional regulator [Cyclobacteriaceae bacterium]|jgi:AcrR family transcriptional regulator|nr:TetR/AcrR family transcriptional regulator [Cyclobacteriaceae bacterium]
MTTITKKEQHKEELKREILLAAKQLLNEKGYEAISLRAIANKIKYSAGTIYLYFKDKNELIHALHQEGFRLLVSHFKLYEVIEHPFERLKALGRAYIQFATQNPDLYQLIFVLPEPLHHVESCGLVDWNEGDRAFDILLKTVSECQEYGYFNGLEKERVSLIIWSTMHGLCTLRTSGHLGHVAAAKSSGYDLDTLMMGSFETYVHMLERLK